jgi:predicted metal-dependent phosphoesterase TrpH
MTEELNTRIDLHNHTILSDGDLDLFSRCRMKKGLLDTICITDHFPDFPNAYTEAKKMSKEYEKLDDRQDLPNLIIGIEYCFANMVEILIFGEDFINDVRENIPRTYQQMEAITKNHQKWGMVICHPLRYDELDNPVLLSMVDGVEITLRGSYLKSLEDRFSKIKDKYSLNLFSNSDYHTGDDPENEAYTIIDGYNISNEDELIDALKTDIKTKNFFMDVVSF